MTELSRYNVQTRKGEWTMGGRWPAGAYALTVDRLSFGTTRKGNSGCTLLLHVPGTNCFLHWYIADTEKAEWAWKPLVDEFHELESLLDRTFIFNVERTSGPTGGKINRVTAVLAEVLS